MKGKLLESSLLLTEASTVGLRPQVKRSPNTLLQKERRPIFTLLGPRALRTLQEPLKIVMPSASEGWDMMIF
jgi:hypothetical protein